MTISWGKYLFLSIIVVITALPFFLAINYVDLDNNAIAFDWKNSFHGAIWLENFGWDTRPFRTPPWSVLFLLPITALPFEIGWALMMYLTTVILVLAVPRRPSRNLWVIGVFLLLTAHPTLRNFADVNLECFVVGGILLLRHAYLHEKPILLSIAVLLATIKPQSVFLLMFILGIDILRMFNKRNIMVFGGITTGVLLLSLLLWGQVWYQTITTTPSGISMQAGLNDLGVHPVLIIICQMIIILLTLGMSLKGQQRLPYSKVGLLVTASILAAPYANGLSLVTLLAFGGIAIFMKRPWLGILIFMLYNLPYIQAFGIDAFTIHDSLYFLIILLITWFILMIDVYQETATSQEKT